MQRFQNEVREAGLDYFDDAVLDTEQRSLGGTEAAKTVDAKHPDTAFYAGKVQAALYYARTELPNVEQGARLMGEEDRSPLETPDAAFATV